MSRASPAKPQDHSLSNVTPPTPLRAAHIAPGAPLHGTLKGALATLVLMLLALLFWQLLDQLQQNQKTSSNTPSTTAPTWQSRSA